MLRKIPKFTQTKYFSSVANLEKLKKNPIKINEYWKDAQLKINLDKEIKFFKTHNACVSYNNNWFTDEINTAEIPVGELKVISIDQNLIRSKWEVIAPSGEKFMIVPDFNKESI